MTKTARFNRDLAREYDETYRRRASSSSVADIEREVCGSCAGVNGYTTLAQAERLAAALHIDERTCVLDVGAGAGFPGVWLAERYGCEVALMDIPLTGIRSAVGRATVTDQRRCAFALGSAVYLPVRSRTFDVVVHTDVVCCVRPKHAMFHECRRVLKPDGRMGYLTIFMPTGLSAAQREAGRRAGPPAVWSRATQSRLLESAGFADIEETDLTDEYLATARGYLAGSERHESEMRSGEGDERFEQRQAEGRACIAGIEAGVLRRALYVARRA